MSNLKPNIFSKSLSVGFLTMMTIPIVFNLTTFGENLSCLPIGVIDILLVPIILQHVYMVSKLHPFGHFIRASFLSGLFSGFFLSLAGRIGLVLNYLIMSSDKNFVVAGHLFIDSWWFYLYAALFGAICMSIKPLRIILKEQILKIE